MCVRGGGGPKNVFQVIIVFCKKPHGTLPAGPIAARVGPNQNFYGNFFKRGGGSRSPSLLLIYL